MGSGGFEEGKHPDKIIFTTFLYQNKKEGTKIGRKKIPKRDHKVSLHITIRKELLARIDEVLKGSERSRTDLVESVLETLLFSDKAYANYMVRQAQLEAAFWEFEFKKAETREKIKTEQLELNQY